MSFPNWSIAKHARWRLFLRIRAIISVRFTATTWRHRRSSTVASAASLEDLNLFFSGSQEKNTKDFSRCSTVQPAVSSFSKSSATLEPTPPLARASSAHARHVIFCFRRLLTENYLQKSTYRWIWKWQFEIKKQKKEKYLQYTMIQAKFWTIGTEQRQVEGKRGFSKCGFANMRVAMPMRKCALQPLTEWLAVILFSPLLRSVPLFRIVDA